MTLVARPGSHAAQLADDLRREGLEVELERPFGGAQDRLPDGLTTVRGPFRPDAVLIDVASFQNLNNAEVALRRVQAGPTPILLLGNSEILNDWVLLSAADDFLIEPLQAKELLSRAALAVLRAGHRGAGGSVSAGRLRLDLIGHKASVEGREVYLTRREFELVRLLVVNEGRVMTREMIGQHMWGASEVAGGLRTIDVHARRIRSKLERDGGRFIETVRNVGYKFVAD